MRGAAIRAEALRRIRPMVERIRREAPEEIKAQARQILDIIDGARVVQEPGKARKGFEGRRRRTRTPP
jgi:hypothetical protein